MNGPLQSGCAASARGKNMGWFSASHHYRGFGASASLRLIRKSFYSLNIFTESIFGLCRLVCLGLKLSLFRQNKLRNSRGHFGVWGIDKKLHRGGERWNP